MFDDLVKQVRRLFSSKNNAGKLVYKLTDRLHGYKLGLLALCIVLLLGHSQFRTHFHCHGAEKYDTKLLDNFCWTNGTSTVNLRDSSDLNPANKHVQIDQDKSAPSIKSIFHKMVGKAASTLCSSLSDDTH